MFYGTIPQKNLRSGGRRKTIFTEIIRNTDINNHIMTHGNSVIWRLDEHEASFLKIS